MTEQILKVLALGAGYAAVGMAATGSALGTGYAGQAAVGAWKKCYQQGKAAPFLLLALVGAPLSQTIYSMSIMMIILLLVLWSGLLFFLVFDVIVCSACYLSSVFIWFCIRRFCV
ncbi:MAG: hypothetical protein MJ016_07480, partial [Victivallaceae bacterium]|nr:hypothetical protein [Victivallaceae bacterium]